VSPGNPNTAGELTITRKAFDSSPLRVLIDDSDVGFLRPFQREKTFTVDAGTHSLQVRKLVEVSDVLVTQIAAGQKLKYKLIRKGDLPRDKTNFWHDLWLQLDLWFFGGFFYWRSVGVYLANPIDDVFIFELKRDE
jgi:hypothetical protein